MGRLPVLPREGDESREGRGEKLTAPELESCCLRWRHPLAVETDVQRSNAVGVFGIGKGFKLKVPFARIGFVGQYRFSTALIACTARVNSTQLASDHRNVQRDGVTSLYACLDETSTILLCDEYRAPHSRLINQRHPPEPAYVGQLREIVQTISGVRRGDELEYPKEDFYGGAVDGTAFRERW